MIPEGTMPFFVLLALGTPGTRVDRARGAAGNVSPVVVMRAVGEPRV